RLKETEVAWLMDPKERAKLHVGIRCDNVPLPLANALDDEFSTLRSLEAGMHPSPMEFLPSFMQAVLFGIHSDHANLRQITSYQRCVSAVQCKVPVERGPGDTERLQISLIVR